MRNLGFAVLIALTMLPSAEASDLDQLLAKVESHQVELTIGNGNFEVSSFELSTFSIAKAKKDLAKIFPSGRSGEGCRFMTTRGENVWNDLISFEEHAANSSNAANAAKTLTDIRATGETLQIFKREWDGDGDKIEYCSKTGYEIYFKNGKRLSIYQDFTT